MRMQFTIADTNSAPIRITTDLVSFSLVPSEAAKPLNVTLDVEPIVTLPAASEKAAAPAPADAAAASETEHLRPAAIAVPDVQGDSAFPFSADDIIPWFDSLSADAGIDLLHRLADRLGEHMRDDDGEDYCDDEDDMEDYSEIPESLCE